ncbi:MAG: hypothetical protein K2P52_03730 [Campylobacterales bacterium]|nr:hypothetical protein [Campylobacterales bacterium]
MNKYKIVAYIFTVFYAIFILNYEPSFYNDDSAFLTRGIDNFSVIDFSPHFPGYTVIVILGKFINIFVNESKYSFFLLSSLCAVFLPLLMFFYVKILTDEKKAFVVFLISISSVYLMNLSLSMLSDSVGLFFFFLSLHMYELKKNRLTGIVASLALFSRPSYLIFFVIGFFYIYFTNKNSLREILIYFLLGTFLFLSYTFFYNGYLYIEEAIRFIQGHFELWGVGQNSDIKWIDNILRLENTPYLLLILSLFSLKKEHIFLWILFLSYFLWMIFAQNPDNIRHMIPLVFLANIIIVLSIKNKILILLPFLIINFYAHSFYKEKISPLENIMKYINNNNNEEIIITNRGVEFLREKLKNKIVDGYYKNSADFISNNKKSLIITTNKPKHKNYIEFKGRFIGEQNLYLFESQN